MDLALLEREVAELNRRFLSLCLRTLESDELLACIHLNLDLSFIRAIKALSTDEVEFLVSSQKSLVKPSITEREVTIAARMSDASTRRLFLQGIRS